MNIERKKEAEPKYSDRVVEINITKQSNYNENRTENDNVEQNIKNENCMKCDRYVETGVQCDIAKDGFISNMKEQEKRK